MAEVNGYKIIGELKNDNSGFSKWGFAKKNGIEYFIKEFLSPIYPLDETVLSSAQLAKKRNICYEFESEKRGFYNILNRCLTGNIITVCDFFRWGSKYYIVTEKVPSVSIDPKDIASKFGLDQKMIIIKVILHNVRTLHRYNIIHGDIKPDNILFKRTVMGTYTAKIIDFDSSFLETAPPQSDEELQGDMVYFAPESYLLIAEEDVNLTRKIDVFALGILFHQYLCGELPHFDKTKYDYPFESVLDGAGLAIDSNVPVFMREIIGSMLAKEPEDRPSLEDVFRWIEDPSTRGTRTADQTPVVVHKPAEKKPNVVGVTSDPASEKTFDKVIYSSGLKSTMRTKRVEETTEEKIETPVIKQEKDYFRTADDFS